MDVTLTWTIGGYGLQVDMDIGHIDFPNIQFYLRNLGGYEL